MKKQNKFLTNIELADAAIQDAAHHLKTYIQNCIADADGEHALAAKTGVPRSTINDTLHRGGVLALRSLAYRLAGAANK